MEHLRGLRTHTAPSTTIVYPDEDTEAQQSRHVMNGRDIASEATVSDTSASETGDEQ